MIEAQDFNKLSLQKEDADAVRWLIKHLKLPKEFQNHLYTMQEEQGVWLSARLWNMAFPRFPMYLVTDSGKDLKSFGKISNFWQPGKRKPQINRMISLVDSVQAEADDRPVCILMRLPYVDGWSVMHNGLVPGDSDPSSVYLKFSADSKPPYDRYVVLERLDEYLVRYKDCIADFLAGGLWTG